MKNGSRLLALLCACTFLAATFILVEAVLHKTGGRFVYALDDPYIHLALAENLAHGHYGLNPGEYTSPASSLLWPFLLTPFAGTHLHVWLPLFWNVVFGIVAAALIGFLVGRYPIRLPHCGTMPLWQQAATAILLLFVANLFSLTILGMEHVLQILLAICCAYALVEVLSDRPIPLWCLAAAVLAPSVRYEDVSLTLAVAVALVGVGLWRRALAVFSLSIVPLIGFSLFLRSKGLPLLPLSVLVKGNAYASAGPASKLFNLVRGAVVAAATEPDRYPILILFFIFAGLTWAAVRIPTDFPRAHRFALAAATLVAGFQLLIGRFGWFHRYEIYAVIFLVLIWLRVLASRPRAFAGALALALVFCASQSIFYTVHTPGASREIFAQQYQMHRFLTDFYRQDFAVGDLGLVSYQRPSNTYVLDLVGLGSLQASQQQNKTPEWLESVVSRHHIRLAILNPDWFAIPAAWTPLARLCLPHVPFAIAEQCVVFYATAPYTPAEAATLHTQLASFATGLPAGDTLAFGHPGPDGDTLFPLVTSRP